MARENRFGKQNQANTGSFSANMETNTQTGDLVLAETALMVPDEEVEITPERLREAIVYSNGVTSIDFMLPDDEREILEKNLNTYSDMQAMEKTLNIAKKNKGLSEDLKSLELVSKMTGLTGKIFDMMTKEENLAVLEKYIQHKFQEGDIAKAYKEIGLMNKALLDARDNMIKKLNTKAGNGKTRIALKFTNDSGEDFRARS